MSDNVFKLWPEPKDGYPYGPTPKQELLFIEELSLEDDIRYTPLGPINLRRPHFHPTDIVLYIGGGGSGKTLCATSRVIKYLMKNDGATAVIGAKNFPLLERSAIREWTARFSKVGPWDHLNLKDRLIFKKPSKHNKEVPFWNRSMAFFQHFDDPKLIRGITASIIHYEEASLLENKEAFNELILRIRSPIGEVRQLILTTNPDELDGWISDTFKLYQDDPDYEGDIEPICDPCSCHLCQRCLNFKGLKSEYVGGEKKYCKRDGKDFLYYWEGGECLVCKKEREDAPENIKTQIPYKKENNCPGNQVYMRVIEVRTDENPHNPIEFAQTSIGALDKVTVAKLVHGKTIMHKEGLVYKSFHKDNVIQYNEPIDYQKDVIWSLDFNNDPQCSVICQEYETDEGYIVKCLDEIIKWAHLPEQVAEHFCEKYSKFKDTQAKILIYGDPSALWGNSNNIKKTYYQIIADVLNEKGFNFEVMMKKPPKGSNTKIKIGVAERIDCANFLLGNNNEDGKIERRIFINKKCEHTIRSLKELKWNDDGKTINKRCDKNAWKSVNKDKIHLMTHPSDALTYYLYKRFSLIKEKSGIIVCQVPGGDSFVYTSNKQEYSNRKEKIKEILEERRIRREKRREERQKSRNEKQNSLKTIFDKYRNI